MSFKIYWMCRIICDIAGMTPNVIVNSIGIANEMLVEKIDEFADRPMTYASMYF